MPDRVKYVKIIFNDSGQIVREYKSIHFDGEGAPRDVEIDPVERFALVGAAQAAGVAAISEIQTARVAAEAEREHYKAAVERSEEKLQVLRAKLDTALAPIAEASPA